MKTLIAIITVALVGCATHTPTPQINIGQANCATARTQIPYLEQQIAVFKAGRIGWPETDEDRKYIAKAKNIIWSLRSTCPAGYL